MGQSDALARMGPVEVHILSVPATAAVWLGVRKAATDSISGRDNPCAMGAITPVLSAVTMSARGLTASSARPGARSTAGSWQVLQRALKIASPLAGEVAV